MANIRVTCPACKSELEIDETFDGQEVECGNCLEVFTAKGPKSSGPGKSGSTGKIPGAGTSRAGTSGAGSSRSKSEDKPAKKKRRDDDDDDDYEHDRRRRDDDDDDEDYAPPPPRRRGSGPGDGAATASLVLGIISIIPGCCCGLISVPTGIAAVITGVVGLKSQANKGQAVGGLVLGCIGLGLLVVRLLAGFGFAAFNQQQFR
jgi:predicted Zn finger-like uncharacterized protein